MAGLGTSAAVRLRSLEANGPAAKAGLKEGDVIAAIDGIPVTGVDDLVRLLDGSRIGKPASLTVLRRLGKTEIAVTPQAREAA